MSDLRGIGFAEVRSRIAGNRLAVYEALRSRGPSTGTELAAQMGWPITSVRPRVTELCEAYHAVATGKRRNSEHEFIALTATEAEALHYRESETYKAAALARSKDVRSPGVWIPAPLVGGPSRQVQDAFNFQ